MANYIYVNDTESFIRKSKSIWGEDTLDYSLANYINRDTLITLICKECNVTYQQLSHYHWRSKGCPECFKKTISKYNKGKKISDNQIKLSKQRMLNRWKDPEYKDEMSKITDSFIKRNKHCRYCSTQENLIPKRRIKKGTEKEEILYDTICYDCSNKRKLKGKCRHCDTTENLMTKEVMNQHLKKPKVVTQDVCKKCFADLTRKRLQGQIIPEETKNKISKTVKKLWKKYGNDLFNTRMNPSKPQTELFKLAKQIYPDALENQSIKTNVSRRYPDILIPSLNLVMEYDGSYWHNSKDDKKRDEELKEVGYKIIHYIDHIPSLLELFGDIRNTILYRDVA